jgi:hypothetical protein
MTRRINVRLPKELFERLREASRHTGLSMNRIVCECLEKALPKIVAPRTYRRNKREAIPLLTPPKK